MKILFVSTSCPYPTTGGGAQRTTLLLRGLQNIGETHLYLLQNESSVPEATRQYLQEQYNLVGVRPIPKHGERNLLRYVRPLAPILIDRLVHNLGDVSRELEPVPELQQEVFALIDAQQYDLVVCRLEGSALAVATWDSVPTIIDIDNYSLQVYAQRVAQSQGNLIARWILNRHYKNLAGTVPGLLKKAKHLWVSTASDKEAIDHPSVSVLSNIPFREHDDTDQQSVNHEPAVSDKKILMVGSLGYPVNIEGLDFYLQNVWPLIHKKHPDATFDIVGRGANEGQIKRWSGNPGVQVIGFLPELKTAYRDCSFAIAPVFAGGGTKIKVLEALMNHRTCVVARHSIRGYEDILIHDDSVLIADGAEHMAEQCSRLLESPEFRDKLSKRGSELVEQHFSYRSFAEGIKTSVAAIGKS